MSHFIFVTTSCGGGRNPVDVESKYSSRMCSYLSRGQGGLKRRGSVTKHIFTDDEKFFTIRNTEPEKLLMLLIPGCLGNACEPQKLLNI